MAMQPKLLVLDAPTKGIQPSIIKPTAPAVPPFQFARNLADHYAGPGRGQITLRPRALR
jgi:hypothetical protein